MIPFFPDDTAMTGAFLAFIPTIHLTCPLMNKSRSTGCVGRNRAVSLILFRSNLLHPLVIMTISSRRRVSGASFKK